MIVDLNIGNNRRINLGIIGAAKLQAKSQSRESIRSHCTETQEFENKLQNTDEKESTKGFIKRAGKLTLAKDWCKLYQHNKAPVTCLQKRMLKSLHFNDVPHMRNTIDIRTSTQESSNIGFTKTFSNFPKSSNARFQYSIKPTLYKSMSQFELNKLKKPDTLEFHSPGVMNECKYPNILKRKLY